MSTSKYLSILHLGNIKNQSLRCPGFHVALSGMVLTGKKQEGKDYKICLLHEKFKAS